MRIPQNKIKLGHTSGNELIYKDGLLPYTGYYFILNNKYYVGKEFTGQNVELILKTDPNYQKMLNLVKQGGKNSFKKILINPNLKKFL